MLRINETKSMIIRSVTESDIDNLYKIFKKIIEKGNSFVWEANSRLKDFKNYWLEAEMTTYVLEDDGRMIGSYMLKPNQKGYGSHIANGAYMVDPDYQGKGAGQLLSTHSIEEARYLGFKAIQFNIVVSTNEPAVRLWKKAGFQIIGTIPNGFKHKELGFVDAYIMFLEL